MSQPKPTAGVRTSARACLSAQTRPAIEVFDHVYDEPHVGLDAQRAQYAAYLDGFAAEGTAVQGGAR